MTFNAIGYFIYLPITAFITIVVGKSFHKNGIYYIKSIVPEKKIAISLNNLLLIGYYLVNIGYAFISIIKWEHISSSHQLIEEISLRTAYIILLLTLMHYINIASIALWSYYKNKYQININ